MKAASTDDIKKELKELPPKQVLELLLRLARFKKGNKELLTYLLFEAHDEAGYISLLLTEIDDLMTATDHSRSAYVKKQLRSIPRLINRQARYIGSKTAPLEMLLHLCSRIAEDESKWLTTPALRSLYESQLKKIDRLLPLVDDDLQYDYRQAREKLGSGNAVYTRRWWQRNRSKS